MPQAEEGIWGQSSRPGSLAVIGSTGSIGQQTLAVMRANPGRFRAVSLAAHSNVELLVSQAREFRPAMVAVAEPQAAVEVARQLQGICRVESGEASLLQAVSLPEVHTAVIAVVGFAGLAPVLRAIEQGKHLALANKECLVAGGPLVRAALTKSRTMLVPVDSEHNSIFQCLMARRSGDRIRRIVLTASGGPFLDWSLDRLASVTPADAVKHPRWRMGAKISVDSATLMNKGLEVIEAAWLFQLPAEQIEVLIHPQSCVHGFVEFEDGTIIAALYEPDMRVPIAAALAYLASSDPRDEPGARTLKSGAAFLDLAEKGSLQFVRPDLTRFPLLKACYDALHKGGTVPVAVNAANESAVNAFLSGRLSFPDISHIVSSTVAAYCPGPLQTIDDVLAADAWARDHAAELCERSYAQMNRADQEGEKQRILVNL